MTRSRYCDCSSAAIAETARAEYTQEQVAAWLGDGGDVGEWHAERSRVRTFVAVENGIGAALVAHVVEVARAEEIRVLTTHASLVARPVFERAGFEVIERETVHRGAVALDRFVMRRAVGL